MTAGVLRPAVLRLVLRPGGRDRALTLLPVAGVAALTATVLTAVALARLLLREDGDAHRVLAVTVITLLLVPLISTASTVARLAARRREDRLAVLRLLGGTPAATRGVPVVETVVTTAIGAAAGTTGHLALVPVLAALPLGGSGTSWLQVLLPWPLALAVLTALIGVSALAAAWGLRAVTVSPLGVARRSRAPRPHRARAIVALLVVAGSLVLLRTASASWGAVVLGAVLVLVLISVMGVLGLVGPYVLSRTAARRAGRAGDAAELIAARTVQEDPAGVWRQVSAAALMTVIAVPVGSFLGYVDVIESSDTVLEEPVAQLFADLRMVLLLTLALAGFLLACSVALTQAAAVLDRRTLLVALDRVGAAREEMERARRLAVVRPLRVAVLGSGLVALTLAWWLVVIAAVHAPFFLAAVLAVPVACEVLVRLALRATRPVVDGALAAPDRAG